jgi:hypothetical protein
MEKDDFLEDDFLRDLVQKSPLESPSDDFVGRVMEQVGTQPVAEKQPFFLTLKAISGYAALFGFAVLFLLTSDYPVLDFIPGKLILKENLLSVLNSFVEPFKLLFGNAKSLSIPIMIVVSAGLFFILDIFLSRRKAIS